LRKKSAPGFLSNIFVSIAQFIPPPTNKNDFLTNPYCSWVVTLQSLNIDNIYLILSNQVLSIKTLRFSNQPKITTPSFRVKKTSHPISFKTYIGLLRFPQHDEMQNNP
jgi:hypothetical protein